MAKYSVAEAKNRLPALIAAAERGEEVTITRYGKPVVEMRRVAANTSERRMSPEELDAFWRDVDAIGLSKDGEDAVALVRAMRDEAEH